jgi:hypothetical protein
MPELIHRERKIVAKGNKLRMYFTEVQEYDEEAIVNIRKEWVKEMSEKKLWLENFAKDDGPRALALKEAEAQMENMRKRIEKDISNLAEGIALWSTPEAVEEWPLK